MIKSLKLSALCKMQSGGTPSRSNLDYYEGDFPWAKISDLEKSDDGYIYKTEEHITQDALHSINNRQFQPGTLLLAMYGSVGKTAITKIHLTTNQAILGINIIDDTILDIKYLKYWFSTIKERLLNRAVGAALPNISLGIVKDLEIPLPTLPEQQKIANILDAADALRQNDKALIAKYDELTQALFLDMFGDPVKNNLNLPFPKIRELSNVSQGMQIAIKERHKENGPNRYKYLTVAYLNGRKEEEYIESPRASVICNKDQILMIRTGNTGQVVTNVEGVFHNNFFKIDWDKKRLNKNYLVYFLSNPGIRRDLLKRASTTTIPDLSHGQFYDLNIIVPPLNLQNQFAERVAVIEEQKTIAQKSLEKSESLFNSLLQKAFKGELN